MSEQQKLANDTFFRMVFQLSTIYVWPDEKEEYQIDGNTISCSFKGYNSLIGITTDRFTSNYSFIINTK